MRVSGTDWVPGGWSVAVLGVVIGINMVLTGVSFLRERTGGTLERLMATPVTRGEVVVGGRKLIGSAMRAHGRNGAPSPWRGLPT